MLKARTGADAVNFADTMSENEPTDTGAAKLQPEEVA